MIESLAFILVLVVVFIPKSSILLNALSILLHRWCRRAISLCRGSLKLRCTCAGAAISHLSHLHLLMPQYRHLFFLGSHAVDEFRYCILGHCLRIQSLGGRGSGHGGMGYALGGAEVGWRRVRRRSRSGSRHPIRTISLRCLCLCTLLVSRLGWTLNVLAGSGGIWRCHRRAVLVWVSREAVRGRKLAASISKLASMSGRCLRRILRVVPVQRSLLSSVVELARRRSTNLTVGGGWCSVSGSVCPTSLWHRCR